MNTHRCQDKYHWTNLIVPGWLSRMNHSITIDYSHVTPASSVSYGDLSTKDGGAQKVAGCWTLARVYASAGGLFGNCCLTREYWEL